MSEHPAAKRHRRYAQAVDEAYARQEAEWQRHAREENAKGICEFSGYEFRTCILGVCDCGWEFLPDDEIDAAIAKVVTKAKEGKR